MRNKFNLKIETEILTKKYLSISHQPAHACSYYETFIEDNLIHKERENIAQNNFIPPKRRVTTQIISSEKKKKLEGLNRNENVFSWKFASGKKTS